MAGAIAEVLSAGHEVDVLGPEPIDLDRTRAQARRRPLALPVSHRGRRHERVGGVTRLRRLRHDDLSVEGGEPRPDRLYYAHFPEEGRTGAQERREAVSRRVVPLLDRLPSMPRRARLVRDDLAARIPDRSFLDSYQSVIANSAFTAHWIRTYWGVEPDVLYPPVRMLAPATKRSLIVSVGRFFAPEFGHCKKQLDLVLAFRALHESGRAEGWEYHLVGGCDHKNREYFNAVRQAAIGLPVELHLNAPGHVVEELFGAASLQWHGAGYGEDLELNPHRAEHFGIAVVEGMSAGAVPMVFAAAGPAEVVRDGTDGVQWRTPGELVERAASLIDDPQRRAALSSSARERAEEFSVARFAERLAALLARLTPEGAGRPTSPA